MTFKNVQFPSHDNSVCRQSLLSGVSGSGCTTRVSDRSVVPSTCSSLMYHRRNPLTTRLRLPMSLRP